MAICCTVDKNVTAAAWLLDKDHTARQLLWSREQQMMAQLSVGQPSPRRVNMWSLSFVCMLMHRAGDWELAWCWAGEQSLGYAMTWLSGSLGFACLNAWLSSHN